MDGTKAPARVVKRVPQIQKANEAVQPKTKLAKPIIISIELGNLPYLLEEGRILQDDGRQPMRKSGEEHLRLLPGSALDSAEIDLSLSRSEMRFPRGFPTIGHARSNADKTPRGFECKREKSSTRYLGSIRRGSRCSNPLTGWSPAFDNCFSNPFETDPEPLQVGFSSSVSAYGRKGTGFVVPVPPSEPLLVVNSDNG